MIVTALAVSVYIIPAGLAQVYLQTNLVSDLPGLATYTDPNLVNPWAIATSATSPFWVADNHTGRSTLYDSSGKPQSLVVSVPAPDGMAGSPTGMVFNGTSDFTISTDVVGMREPARFIFATEDGTIAGWSAGAMTTARITVNNAASGAIYKGLAMANKGTENFLYATDFHNGKIDVFDANYAPAALAGTFSDPTIPKGFAPFGIENIRGVLYVTYALQDDEAEDDVPGPGNGFINKFDPNGNLLGRFASRGSLNSPWGLVVAPTTFGEFAGALLVGNFGDGRINAFDPISGELLGQLEDASGHPIAIEGLWGLRFGNGGRGGDANTLYFAAGIAGPDSLEDHGLFGSIGFVPAERQLVNISTRAFVGAGDNVAIAGFILRTDEAQGLESKRVLLRGLGSSLQVQGTAIPGRLVDPVLELHDSSGQTIALNDDWKDTQRSAIEATGLAPSADQEAAMLVMLATGSSYTAILRGKNNTTGIGLIEGYDLEPTTHTHLANLSGRAFISTGDNVLIGGLIVSGAAAEQILIRAIGPSLVAKGVSSALRDPTLDLYDGQGNLLAHNDNWMEQPDGAPDPVRTAQIMATGLAPSSASEAAILTTPSPGAYTAVLRGKSNTTGVGLLEAYRLGPPITRQP